MPDTPDSANFSHFVFVDFENVPGVELDFPAGQPVHVTLVIGEKQRRLELPLVRQIHRHASQVTLVEVGGSGRNALDLVLACHLGKSVEQHPGASFYIVSKDKDFDPLIAHLRAEQVKASRHPSFAELPCIRPAPRSHARPGSLHAPAAAAPATAAPPAADDRLARVIATLAKPNRSRPKRKKSLLAHINALFANALSADEQNAALEELIRRGVLRVDDQGRVSY